MMRECTGIASAATWHHDYSTMLVECEVFNRATYPRRSAKIQEHLALFQKPILLVQLDQLERSTRSVAFLFCELVPLVKTAFAVL